MKWYFKGLGIVVVFVIVLSIFLNFGTVETYGNENNTIEVETYGNNTKGNPMFSEGLWAPGVQQEGVMRIKNNYSQRVKIDHLALVMELEKLENGEYKPVEDKELIEKYAKSMKLKITRGRLLVFNEMLYDKSFYEMLYEKENQGYQGYQLPSSKQFNINKNDSIDLKYSIEMDGENAGNELQGLRATVDFVVNLHENPTSSGSGGRKDKDEGEKELVEELALVIPDISGHWAENCILRLLEEGIIVGYPDDTIKPDNTITRAETAVLIGRALQLEEKDKLLAGYLDPIPKWARGYIHATTEEGAFEGYPAIIGKVFRPNRLITREEMATALMRGFQLALEEDITLEFTDKKDISDWALEFVKSGVQNNIIVGYPDDTFKPQDNITRAEAFTMICKLLGYNTESEE
ncbi:MAG: S-layer homology domain-containing protein [Clostridiaceae bacterium]|nr:S-layer homology domain-containing protein [Clostridiaceae bacterium]